MKGEQLALRASFVNVHFVDDEFHKAHSQLIHQHNDVIELFYVMKGSGRYIVGEYEYQVQAGSLLVCNAKVLHGESYLREHQMQSYCCVMNGLQLPGLPSNTLMERTCNPLFHYPLNKAPVEHIYLALHQLSLQKTRNSDTCNLLANALLNLVYDEVKTRDSNYGAVNRKTEELLQQITQYLDEHYMEAVNLQAIAERFHLNYYYLVHIFKAKVGLSPMKYVTNRRIGEAQNLLMNTDLQITEIGDKLGFHDSCHFSSMFKKYIGITPSQYRKHFNTADSVKK